MVKEHSQHPPSNLLLAALSPEDSALIGPRLEPVELGRRVVLHRPQTTIEHVYFPSSGIASLVGYIDRDRFVELGIHGREGMSGLPVVMGDDRWPYECFMQVAGEGQRISSDALREAMEESSSLRLFLLHYVQVFQIQTAHTALANGQALLEERLCRWLLMCHDRMDGDEVPLTHEFLALMLGVRRAGVTTAIHILEDRALVRATRGVIRVIDRMGMEACGGGSYGVPEAEYQRLFGVSPKAPQWRCGSRGHA